MLPTLRTGTSGILPSLLLEEWPFDHFVKSLNGGSNGEFGHKFFAADVAEYPDRYVICMDVPGICRENIDLSMEKNTLSIKIERDQPTEDESAKFLHRGRWYGSTVRSVTLPEAASTEEVEAGLRDGVLTIELKKQPEKQAKKIQIKALN